MKRFDVKHIAYHVLVALYFVWLVVFGVLIAMALITIFNTRNNELSRMLMLWIIFNQVMGTALFLVLRLFSKSNALHKVLHYSYYFMAAMAVISVIAISHT